LQIKFHKIFYVEINFHILATAFPIAASQQKQFSNHALRRQPATTTPGQKQAWQGQPHAIHNTAGMKKGRSMRP
jgi:hypothetical protein